MTTCFALAAGLYLALNEVELKGDARRARELAKAVTPSRTPGYFGFFFLVLFFLPIGTPKQLQLLPVVALRIELSAIRLSDACIFL